MSQKGKNTMKKTYKIDVDCANCANKMEEAAKNTAGVKDATVNFMMLKMIVEFEDGPESSYERCSGKLQESRRRLRNLSLIQERFLLIIYLRELS